MRRLFYIFLVWIVPVMHLQAQSTVDSAATNQADAPKIAVTKLDVNDTKLELSYEIINDTKKEIWICEDIAINRIEPHFEAYMAEYKETLMIRKRLDITFMDNIVTSPDGRYVRLEAGQSKTEFLLLPIPVESLFFWSSPTTQGKSYLKRLTLEIGYYPDNLPDMIRQILQIAEQCGNVKILDQLPPREYMDTYYRRRSIADFYFKGLLIREQFGGLLRFYSDNWPNNKHVRHRGEEVIIPWSGSDIRMGEQVLRTSIDDVRIPYEEKYDLPEFSPPDFNNCSRLEIVYHPSVLNYFFPYLNERDLFSAKEIAYLQSLQKIIVDDQEYIKAFADEVKKEGFPGGIFTKQSTAHVTCYSDDNRLASFTVCDDSAIITEKEQCIRYSLGLTSLRELTTQIKPFQLRLECADNLKNLQIILNFIYGRMNKYPSSKWCDVIISDRRTKDIPERGKIKYLKCQSAGGGKCHYAMNPNCKPDSHPEMVLLFEAKAGWNQHGGPELFTFDNHEPRGGCVLLNNGTVKFIRTEEELNKLRWK